MTEEIKQEEHSLLFPFTTVIFGKSFPCDITAIFIVQRSESGRSFSIKALTGKDQTGKVFIMDYLLEEGSPHKSFIIKNIIDNEPNWDKDYAWGW